MRRTVVGQFESHQRAVLGVEALRAHGFEIDHVRDDVLVSVHVDKSRLAEAREALLEAGALSVSVDVTAS